MADDDVADVEFAEHAGGDFAGVGAGGGFVEVLCAETDVGDGVEQLADGGQGGEGGTEDDFGLVEAADFLEEVGDEHAGLSLGFVHFPITGDDFFAGDHKVIF
jgi:hypothetical protein